MDLSLWIATQSPQALLALGALVGFFGAWAGYWLLVLGQRAGFLP